MSLPWYLKRLAIAAAFVLPGMIDTAVGQDLRAMCVGLAESRLAQAKRHERAEDFGMAAVLYTEVLKYEGDCDLAEVKSMAGFGLCGVRIKQRQFQKARDACYQVIQMPDARQEYKAAARALLDKIKDLQ